MKLLLDQNLSRRLLPDLVLSFPGSTQAQHAGLERVGDADIWAYAKQHGFTIVTKDADFAELALLRGYPPKVIWLNCGNVSKEELSYQASSMRCKMVKINQATSASTKQAQLQCCTLEAPARMRTALR